jgi:SAM-dependent MidA family methyltransferase
LKNIIILLKHLTKYFIIIIRNLFILSNFKNFKKMIGVWFLNELLILKGLYGEDLPKIVQFIELGPGRGTMMNDIIRVDNFNKKRYINKL